MTPHPGADSHMWIAAGILVGAYVLIFSEIIHRTHAAIIGAVVMVAVGTYSGFYSEQQAIRAIDGNTILLLAAMMMLVAMLRPTGAFEYTAVRIARIAAHSPRRLLILLSLAVSLISMMLDNVTTLIVFAPLTVLIARILSLNPLPFLMSEAILSNIGGAATLVGDPPNIMIGSAAALSFNDFLLHMAPLMGLVWACTVGLLLLLFRDQLNPGTHAIEADFFDLDSAVTDRTALLLALLPLVLVVALFFVHHELNIFPAFAALIALALGLILTRPAPEQLFSEVQWSVLIFFVALFVIVGGVESSGLLELLGRQLAATAQDPRQLLLACLILMWVSALLSAVVDNIPFTVTMIPIIVGLHSSGVHTVPLWWALAIGVGLGGNSTHIGATANLIAVTEAENSHIPGSRITPGDWIRAGVPTTLVGLAVSSLAYLLAFDFFR